MVMARETSDPAYPETETETFYAAASFAGLHGCAKQVSSKDTEITLYALYQQATVGPCNTPKPSLWRQVERSKWKSWQGLGTMPSIEAMRLFVKILEEGDPDWYSRASNDIPDPVVDVEINRTKDETVVENGNSFGKTKTISTENGRWAETQDEDSEDPDTVSVCNQWTAPQISGQRPKARYEHGAAVIQNKMYIYGGNHDGRYLGDFHVLDLKTWTWSRVEAKVASESQEASIRLLLSPCAGHSLVPWGNKLLSIGGLAKDPSESSVTLKAFDTRTCTCSMLKTHGKPPVSRRGQSVTTAGKTLVMFGGQDAKGSFLNDLHILDLETMTWREIDAGGGLPSARSSHAAAVHAERYLLIFGGGSHATGLNDDLHVLDLQTMEWSQPAQQGDAPSPRAGHAGVTIGEKWFIVGGCDDKNGAYVLNMSTFTWSVIAPVEGCAPLTSSKGLSLVVSSYDGEDVLVAFGGYNGRYNDEINLLIPSHTSLFLETLEKVFGILQPALSLPIGFYMKFRKEKHAFQGDKSFRPLEPKDPLGYVYDGFITGCSQGLFREVEFQSRNSPGFVRQCNKLATGSHNLLAKTALYIIMEPSAYSKMKRYRGAGGMYAIVRVAVPVLIAAGLEAKNKLMEKKASKKSIESTNWKNDVTDLRSHHESLRSEVKESLEEFKREMKDREEESRAKEEMRQNEVKEKIENLEIESIITNWNLAMMKTMRAEGNKLRTRKFGGIKFEINF